MRLVKPPSHRLADPLPCDIRQMVVLIVRFFVSPHDENYFQPLGSQSPKRLVMGMSSGPLVAIVSVRPLTAVKRDKGQPVRGVTQKLVVTKLYNMALTTGLGYRDSTCLGLKVAERFPATLDITELGPKHRDDGAAFSSRQRLYQFSCRHRGEKTLDLLAVALDRLNQGLQLNHQHPKQLRLGSDDVLGNGQLRLAKLLPQLFTACLAEMVLTLGKTVPVPAGKLRQRSWGKPGVTL
jgi:hypothetical protein